MKLFSLIAAFLLVSMVGCMDAPTAPIADDYANDAVVLDEAFGKAAQGDRSEWYLFTEWDIKEGDFAVGFMQCLNGGEGEDAWFVGTGRWFAKTVETPSGNVNHTLKYELDENSQLIGIASGDVWNSYKFQSHFFQHTKQSDGQIYFYQPDQEWFVNEATGQRIKGFWQVWIVYDEVFNIVEFKSTLKCASMGRK